MYTSLCWSDAVHRQSGTLTTSSFTLHGLKCTLCLGTVICCYDSFFWEGFAPGFGCGCRFAPIRQQDHQHKVQHCRMMRSGSHSVIQFSQKDGLNGVDVRSFHSDSESRFFKGLALCSHALSWWHRKRSFQTVATKLDAHYCFNSPFST